MARRWPCLRGVPGGRRLARPKGVGAPALTRAVYTVTAQEATTSLLQQLGPTLTLETVASGLDARTTATDLAARYRVDLWSVYDEIVRLYGGDEIPEDELEALGRQIEDQSSRYEIREATVDVALALVKLQGFVKENDAEGVAVYTAEIVYHKDNEQLLLSWQAIREHNSRDLGFHYSPTTSTRIPKRASSSYYSTIWISTRATLKTCTSPGPSPTRARPIFRRVQGREGQVAALHAPIS